MVQFTVAALSFLFFSLSVVRGEDDVCRDLFPRHCAKWANKGYCTNPTYIKSLQRNCQKTCNFCKEPSCLDLVEEERCEKWMQMGFCEEGQVTELCSATCGTCTRKCPELYVKNGYFLGTSVRNGKTGTVAPLEKGSVVEMVCHEGYNLMGGASTVQCQGNGQYNDTLGVCISSNECIVPKYGIDYKQIDRYYLVSESMSFNQKAVSPGTYAILVCKNGRRQQSYCSSFGTWLPAFKDCHDDRVDWDRWSDHDMSNLTKRRNKSGVEFGGETNEVAAQIQ